MPMKLFNENPYSRVMVFIDYRNIDSALSPAREIGSLDLFRLTQILVGKRELIGAYVFDGRPHVVVEGDPIDALHNNLRDQGFRVIERDALVHRGDKTEQKEVDVSLACEMLEHAMMNHYDVAIMVSGDRDFVPAIQKVQAAGKRVEVASVSGAFNKESKRTADAYYELDHMPILMLEPLPMDVCRWSIFWIFSASSWRRGNRDSVRTPPFARLGSSSTS